MSLKDDPELTKLIAESVAKFKAMTPEQQEEMMRIQREGYVKAEMSWPKPNFHWEGNIKVYHSYEDYCND